MNKIIFYKWYGLVIALIIQAFFFFIYQELQIKDKSTMMNIIFIGGYQLVFIVTTVQYILLYKAYKKFVDLKKKNEEEEVIN